jgi:hypothetical protein
LILRHFSGDQKPVPSVIPTGCCANLVTSAAPPDAPSSIDSQGASTRDLSEIRAYVRERAKGPDYRLALQPIVSTYDLPLPGSRPPNAAAATRR